MVPLDDFLNVNLGEAAGASSIAFKSPLEPDTLLDLELSALQRV